MSNDLTHRIERLRRKLITELDPEERADLEASIAALEATMPRTHQQTFTDHVQVGVAIAGDVSGVIYLEGRRSNQAAQLLRRYLELLCLRYSSLPFQALYQPRHNDHQSTGLAAFYTQGAVDALVEREVLTTPQERAQFDAEAYLRNHVGPSIMPLDQRDSILIADKATMRDGKDIGRSSGGGAELARIDAGELQQMITTASDDRIAFIGPQLVTEAIAATQRLVLLGEPGSGKSTALRFLALTLAEAALDPAIRGANQGTGWEPLGDATRLLPLFLPLLPFARTLAATPTMTDTAKELWNHIADELEPNGANKGLATAMHAELSAGRVLVMFDGLDEIVGALSRQKIVQAVAQFATEYPQCRVVVSCRVRAYEGAQNEAWQLPGWPTARLQSWGAGQQQSFIVAWCLAATNAGSLPEAQRESRVASLRHAIMTSPDLQRLASSPLLLTVIALVHLNDRRLPEDRVTLYSRCIDILLAQWEQRGKDASDYGSLMDYIGLPERDVQRLRPLFAKAAYTAHQAATPANPGSLSVETLRTMTMDYLAQLGHPNPYLGAQKLLEYTDHRAGLLQASSAGDIYVFPNLTFQEYLAGLELTSGINVVVRLIAHSNDDRWREPIILGISDYVSSGKLELPFQLLTELIKRSEPITDQEYRHLLFANDIVHNIGRDRLLQGGQPFQLLLDDLTEALTSLAGNGVTLSSESVGQLEFSREWSAYLESHSSPIQSLSTSQKILHRLASATKLAITAEFVYASEIPMFLLDQSSLHDSIAISGDLPIIVWPWLLPDNSNDMWSTIKSCIPPRLGIACLFLPIYTRDNQPIVNNVRQQADIDAVDLVILSRTDIELILEAQNSNRAFLQLMINQLRLDRMRLYQTEGAVEGKKFFGREHEIRVIRDQITTTSFILVGTRRIGKSSILQRLAESELPKASVLPIYIQIQDANKFDGNLNYRLFVHRLCEAREVKTGHHQRFDNLQDFFSQLPGTLMPVLLVDEADALISADRQNDWRLFTELRQLAQSRRCQFVFAGEMAFRQVRLEADTPFFNFAEEIVVGTFDQSITSELFQRPMKQMGINIQEPERCAKLVYEFTGGHPNIVQRLCEQLLRLIQPRPIRELTYFDVKMVRLFGNRRTHHKM